MDKLSENDIDMFAVKVGVTLTEVERSILYETVKEKYQILLYGDANPIFADLKSKLSTENYQKIYTLYHEYKEKYQSYL